MLTPGVGVGEGVADGPGVDVGSGLDEGDGLDAGDDEQPARSATASRRVRREAAGADMGFLSWDRVVPSCREADVLARATRRSGEEAAGC
jgi:hypothetical protein